MKIGGIILAGGIGERFGGKVPKQFLKLGKKIILRISIEKFLFLCDDIIVVSNKNWVKKTREITADYSRVTVVEGGGTRQLSVFNGLNELTARDISIVAIHDSVRPLFSRELLKRSIESAIKNGSGIPVIPVNSSLACVEKNIIFQYIDRGKVFSIQTPQTFQFDLISTAHKIMYENGKFDYTDDSQLLKAVNREAAVVMGEESNIKITTQLDRLLAMKILSQLPAVDI